MKRALRVYGFLLLSAAACAQQYVISTYAGGAPLPTPSPGLSLSIGFVRGMAADVAGNAYFTSFNCVFKLDRNGVVTRMAGNSRRGYSGDGGPATSAQLNNPSALAVDGAGNLFIADQSNFRIRKVSPDGIIVTAAGIGTQGFSGDGGPATSAQFRDADGVAVDGAGNLFIGDSGNRRVRKISRDGIIVTVAGDGTQGFSGDSGPATSAQLNPNGPVAVDRAGNLFIADQGHVRKVSPDGIITTVAGNGLGGFSGDGGPATSARVGASGVAVDDAGDLFIADVPNGRIRKVSPDGTITTVAGSGTNGLGDGGPATSAQLAPSAVAVDGAGNLFVADFSSRLRKVSPDGIITTVAGSGTNGLGDGGPATGAQLSGPNGVAVDRAGNLFIADFYRIRKVSTTGIISTVAGNGTSGFSGDGGPALNAQLSPFSVAVDDADDLYFADSSDGCGDYGNRVRKVSPSGTITTVAGNGTYGSSGDGGPATDAQFNLPTGVAVDGARNLFIADYGNKRIRVVSQEGTILTYVAQLSYPVGLAVDGADNLFITDYSLIYKVSPSRIVTTVAGNGTYGSSGDGGPATGAQLSNPRGVAVDGAGNLFIADSLNRRIRKVSPSGIITTVAGTGVPGFSGDGGPANSAQIGYPVSVAVDGAGNVYVADSDNSAVRVLRPTNHSVSIGAVVDAASQRAESISPGKIVVIYGAGLGPTKLIQNQASNGQFGTSLSGTSVSFKGIAAAILYTSATQVAAVVPYAVTGTTAQVTVAYQGETSAAFTVPVALSAPSLFTLNQTGAGQAAAVNVEGTVNTAANPVKIGGYISLYATGEGQTSPGGVDGKLGGTTPILPVRVTVGGIPAMVQSAGGAPGQVSGLMQVNVRIPNGVQPGGYVPVALQVGDASTTPGAVWIAVAAN